MRKLRADKARLDGAAAPQANLTRSQTAPSTQLGSSDYAGLDPPEVRVRTKGVIACRPQVA